MRIFFMQILGFGRRLNTHFEKSDQILKVQKEPENPIPKSTEKRKGFIQSLFNWAIADLETSANSFVQDVEERLSGPIRLGKLIIHAATSQAATAAIEIFVNSMAKGAKKENIKEKIELAKNRMMQFTNGDFQFFEFQEFISHLIINGTTNRIRSLLYEWDPKKFLSQEMAEDIIRVNIANAFANLTEAVHKNKDQIPNYENQTSLVNAIAFLCQKFSKHTTLQKLAAIQEKYTPQDKEAALREIDPHMVQDLVLRKKLIKEYFDQLYDKKKGARILTKLFPNICNASQELKDKIIHWIRRERIQNKELMEIFGGIADDILAIFFPKELEDFQLPGSATSFFFQAISEDKELRFYFHYKFRNALASFLIEQYFPLQNKLKGDQWIHDIQNQTGTATVEPLTHGPTLLFIELIKQYIKNYPIASSFAAKIITNTENHQADIAEQEIIVRQMAEQQLPGWIVHSLQLMVYSKDPALAKAGFFVQETMQNLILGMMAKGADIVVPKDNVVPPNQFIQVLIESLIGKIKALSNAGELSKKDLEEFIKDLPIPPIFKEPLAVQIASKDLQKAFEPLKKIHTLHQASLAQLRDIQGGLQIIPLIEKLTNAIVESMLRRHEELIESAGLEDTLDDLLVQYLPGMKIEDEFKNWFKSNIGSFGNHPGSIYSVSLLKETIQAIILHTISHTIKTHYNNEGEKFAAQVIKQMRESFTTTFQDFFDRDKKDLEDAWAIQQKIHPMEAQHKLMHRQIERLSKRLKDKPKHKEIVRLTEHADKARSHIQDLDDKCLNHLKLLAQDDPASLKSFEKIEQTLDWQKTIDATLKTYRERFPRLIKLFFLLKTKKRKLEKISWVDETDPKVHEGRKSDIEHYNNTIKLLRMKPEKLHLIKEFLTTVNSLQAANRELVHLEERVLGLRQDLILLKENLNGVDDIIEQRRAMVKLNIDIIKEKDMLTGKLTRFQVLSTKWMALFGLGHKDRLLLPAFLQDNIWLQIESVKKIQVAQYLFEQLAPMILPYCNREANINELNRISGNEILSNQVQYYV